MTEVMKMKIIVFVEPACGDGGIAIVCAFVCVSVRICLSGFVWTSTFIFMDGFQNNLAQLFSLMSRSAI